MRIIGFGWISAVVLAISGLAIPAAPVQGRNVRFDPANGAKNVSPDAHLTLTFPQSPIVGRSGEIRVYDASNRSLVDRIDISIPAGPAGRPARGTPSAGTPPVEYQKAIIGGFKEGFHFYPIIVHEQTATITLHPGVLKYGRSYYVELDSGVLSSADGFAGIRGPQEWTFRTRSGPPPANTTRLVVAADGTGDFQTVQGAVDFVPAGGHPRIVIFIRRGRYEEIVYFRNKQDITFLGEDRDGVVIGYANNENFNGPPAAVATNELPETFPYRRAAFMADASSGIQIVNLTLRNFTPQGGSQAEALLLMGGHNIVSHVNAFSYQDTIQFNDSVYVADSVIEGETDFLWGRGPAFFERTTLREVSNSPYMWVRSTASSHGFVFVRCRFETPGSSGSGPFLARNTAQYPNSEIVLIDSLIGRIHPAAWSLPENWGQMRYWESGSRDLATGQSADVRNRNAASKQLDPNRDASVITQYRSPAFVLGGWNPQMAPMILSSPKSVVASAGSAMSLSVEVAAIPEAVVEWRRDGKVLNNDDRVSGAETATLTISSLRRSDAGRYTAVTINDSGRAESTAALLTIR